jgi:hypothetical protein
VPDPSEPLPKPDELLALHDVTRQLFELLRSWFDVPHRVALDLTDIDAAVRDMGDPVMIAALAMRKLQALRLLSTPGVATTTDVVVTIVQDLDRALVQAPSMHLRRQAEHTDWDAALSDLLDDGQAPDTGETGGAGQHPSVEVDQPDQVIEWFRALHRQLHDAVRAVVEASDGEIRVFH